MIQITSIEAFYAHQASRKADGQRHRIMEFILEKGGDWSIGEIAHALHMEKSTVSARLNELVYETHELIERPKRLDRISRIRIRPVGLPAMQLSLFGRERE